MKAPDSRLAPLSGTGWESRILKLEDRGWRIQWRIDHMQMFGWNLHSKQTISYTVSEESDTDKDGHTTTSVETDFFTELHFVRRLDFPNLNILRNLEKEYPFKEPLGPQKPNWLFGELFRKPKNEERWRDFQKVYEKRFQIIEKLKEIDREKFNLVGAKVEKGLQTYFANVRNQYESWKGEETH